MDLEKINISITDNCGMTLRVSNDYEKPGCRQEDYISFIVTDNNTNEKKIEMLMTKECLYQMILNFKCQ